MASGDDMRDAIEDARRINTNMVVMPDGTVGHFTEIRQTEKGIIASGGWCAPSAAIYGMIQAEPDVSLPVERDPLPVVNEVTMRTEWVVLPDESFYGDEPPYETRIAAQAEFERRVANATEDEAVSLVRREVVEHVVAAQHGTYVPLPRDPNETGLPLMPTAPRGGIQYPSNRPTEEQE